MQGNSNSAAEQNEERYLPHINPELKHINEALRTSENRFRAIVNQSNTGIAECSLTGQFIFTNKRFTDITGYTDETLLSMHMQDIIHPDDVAQYNDWFQGLVKRKAGFETELRLMRADDLPVQIHFHASLLTDVHNNPFSFIATVRKTNNGNRQETKQPQEEKSLAVLDSITDAFFVVNSNWQFTYINKKAEQLNNRAHNTLLGKVIWDEFPALVQSDYGDLYRRVAEQKMPGSVTAVSAVDNQWYEVHAFPTDNGIVAYFKNITERKQAEEALRQSEERYSAIIHQATAGVVEIDLGGNYLFVNKKWCEITGFSEDELYKMKFFDYVHPDDVMQCKRLFLQTAASGKPFINEKRIICKDKTEVWINETISSISDAYNNTQSIVAVCIDITDRKTIEKQKDEFIGIASHELKTPVTSLKAYAQVLQMRFEKAGDQVSADMLQKMENQINRLAILINDLLDITRIEGKMMAFRREVFDFRTMVTNTVEEVQRTLPSHTIICHDIPQATIFADVERTSQALVNFLTNAAKYSPNADRIIVSVYVENDSIICSVQDFGIGIPVESHKYIFDRFYRVTDSTRSTYPGLGLGLYISSEIIKKQQGDIWFTSSVGEGSVFNFRLPLYHQA